MWPLLLWILEYRLTKTKRSNNDVYFQTLDGLAHLTLNHQLQTRSPDTPEVYSMQNLLWNHGLSKDENRLAQGPANSRYGIANDSIAATMQTTERSKEWRQLQEAAKESKGEGST